MLIAIFLSLLGFINHKLAWIIKIPSLSMWIIVFFSHLLWKHWINHVFFPTVTQTVCFFFVFSFYLPCSSSCLEDDSDPLCCEIRPLLVILCHLCPSFNLTKPQSVAFLLCPPASTVSVPFLCYFSLLPVQLHLCFCNAVHKNMFLCLGFIRFCLSILFCVFYIVTDSDSVQFRHISSLTILLLVPSAS